MSANFKSSFEVYERRDLAQNKLCLQNPIFQTDETRRVIEKW